MATVIINTATKRAAKNVIDKLAMKHGLCLTDWEYCAFGSTMTATLQDDNTVELTSSVLEESTLIRRAKAATRARVVC